MDVTAVRIQSSLRKVLPECSRKSLYVNGWITVMWYVFGIAHKGKYFKGSRKIESQRPRYCQLISSTVQEWSWVPD